jgi:hypothetical protein
MFLFLVEDKGDPVKELVLQFLASYAGIVAGVAFLTSGLKWVAKKFVEGREPLVAIVLTFVLGSIAKIVIPAVYGANTAQAWGLHEIILLFAAIGAQQFHDKIMNPLMGKLTGGAQPKEGGDPLKAPSTPPKKSVRVRIHARPLAFSTAKRKCSPAARQAAQSRNPEDRPAGVRLRREGPSLDADEGPPEGAHRVPGAPRSEASEGPGGIDGPGRHQKGHRRDRQGPREEAPGGQHRGA